MHKSTIIGPQVCILEPTCNLLWGRTRNDYVYV